MATHGLPSVHEELYIRMSPRQFRAYLRLLENSYPAVRMGDMDNETIHVLDHTNEVMTEHFIMLDGTTSGWIFEDHDWQPLPDYLVFADRQQLASYLER